MIRALGGVPSAAASKRDVLVSVTHVVPMVAHNVGSTLVPSGGIPCVV